jgi:hypothetical protein
MTMPSNINDAGSNEEPGVIEFTCTPVSPTKFAVMARRGGKLLHSDTLDPRNAKARAGLIAAVAARMAAEDVGEEVAEAELGARLLEAVEVITQGGDGDEAVPRYHVVEGSQDPELDGIYAGPRQLINCDLRIVEEVVRRDGGEEERLFLLRVTRRGEGIGFRLPAADYAYGLKFISALMEAGGAKIQVSCRPEELCRAVSSLSDPTRTTLTTDFGWTPQGDVFLTPSVRIDATGIHETSPADQVRVDLSDEESARHLDLAIPSPSELSDLKRHFVEDLLGLTSRRVTYAMAAAPALAVLIRFAPEMNRPALWLVGLTGDGKSFLGRLFSCLFGRFPIADGSRLGSWSSTANFIQRQGYFFKDCIYLVDDYKSDLVRSADVHKVNQNYADMSARGRLYATGRANVVRPIRGLLVSTGEDIPEQSASAIARTVIVRVPRGKKDLERGRRCRDASPRYPALMAAFIHHLISKQRSSRFAKRVSEKQDFFLEGIAGRQNDLRIAGNFALISAAFAEFARFLGPELGDWKAEVASFDAELVEIRDEMLAEVEEQQPDAVFLGAIRCLVESGQVRIDGATPDGVTLKSLEYKPVIGKILPHGKPGSRRIIAIATTPAIKAVQEHRKRLAKPPLAVSERALIGQLAGSGKIVKKDGSPFGPDDGSHTWSVKLHGQSLKSFFVLATEFIDAPNCKPKSLGIGAAAEASPGPGTTCTAAEPVDQAIPGADGVANDADGTSVPDVTMPQVPPCEVAETPDPDLAASGVAVGTGESGGCLDPVDAAQGNEGPTKERAATATGDPEGTQDSQARASDKGPAKPRAKGGLSKARKPKT